MFLFFKSDFNVSIFRWKLNRIVHAKRSVNACVAYSENSTNVDCYCGIVLLSWEDCVNELKCGEFQNSLGQVE